MDILVAHTNSKCNSRRIYILYSAAWILDGLTLSDRARGGSTYPSDLVQKRFTKGSGRKILFYLLKYYFPHSRNQVNFKNKVLCQTRILYSSMWHFIHNRRKEGRCPIKCLLGRNHNYTPIILRGNNLWNTSHATPSICNVKTVIITSQLWRIFAIYSDK